MLEPEAQEEAHHEAADLSSQHNHHLPHTNSTLGRTREERVRQVREKDASVRDFAAYVPVGEAASKLRRWQEQGAALGYLSSHKRQRVSITCQMTFPSSKRRKDKAHAR